MSASSCASSSASLSPAFSGSERRRGLRRDRSGISGWAILALVLFAVGAIASVLSGLQLDDFSLILVTIILVVAIGSTLIAARGAFFWSLYLFIFWAGFAIVQWAV